MTMQASSMNIPRVIAPPILGWRGQVADFARDSVGFLTRVHDRYGKMARMGEGKMSATFTFHPDFTMQILSNPKLFYSFTLEDIPFPFSDIEALKSMTTALAMLNGEQHKRQRRLMAPAFHANTLPIYVDQIRDIVNKFFVHWKTGDIVNIYEAVDLFTIHLSMEIFVGMEADEEGRRFAHLFETVLRLLFYPPTFLLPYDLPGFPYRRLRVQGTILERQLKDLIHRRREKGLGGTDSLSLFLQAHDEDGSMMTDDEIVGETVAVFRGGSKTSAGALSWTLYLLSQHPEIYSRLMDELAGTLRGVAPSYEHLNKLPLLEGVIKESLRLVPPVVFGVRYSMEPFEMGGYGFEKDSSVIYSSHVTHRLPEIYKDPHRFNPYRWETLKPSPYEYFPFNAGPRRCLGAEFAMMELKITLAILLQRYRFHLIPGQRIDRIGLTGSIPKQGIQMRIDSLDSGFSRADVRGSVNKFLPMK
jgi:cytochrome P450